MRLKYEIEPITPGESYQKWGKYFLKEYHLWSDLSNLCHVFARIRIFDNHITKSRDLIIKYGYKHSFEAIFGKDIIDNDLLLERTLGFLKRMNDRIDDYFDPTLNALQSCNPGAYPEGSLWVASASLDDDIVMSMLVVPTPDQKAQTHEYIFKSLSFLIKAHLEDIEPIKEIAMPLHAFAGKKMGCEYIVTRPVGQMNNILQSAGFMRFNNDEQLAQEILGKTALDYTNRYGIKRDERYPLTYHQNTPELQLRYELRNQQHIAPDTDLLQAQNTLVTTSSGSTEAFHTIKEALHTVKSDEVTGATERSDAKFSAGKK